METTTFLSFERLEALENLILPKFVHASGGIHLNYRNEDEEIKKVMLAVIKKLGQKLLDGELDVMNLSKPAIMSAPLSFLECVANDFIYCPEYFKKAANTKDSLERMKLIITPIIAGWHVSSSRISHKAPLDPAIGETIQLENSLGTLFYAEQLLKKPNILYFYMQDKDKDFILYGNSEIKAKLSGLNSLTGCRNGHNTVKFKNGEEISFTNPDLEINGLLTGERILTFKKTVFFYDKKNSLMGEIVFNPHLLNKNNGSFMKKLFKKKETIPNDSYTITFYNYSETDDKKIIKTEISKTMGRWTSFVQFNDLIYWKINNSFIEWKSIENEKNILPSDSTCRMDRKYIEEDEIDIAQKFY